MARKNTAIRWGTNAIGVVCSALVRLLGGWHEWEVQTAEPDGCWRTWSDGFPSLEDAMKSLLADRAAGKRWNQYMTDDMVKWRVERRIVWTRYYEPNSELSQRKPE